MKTLDDAGYAPSHLRMWRQAAMKPSGMILMCGSVGSGKSSTAKAFLETLPGLQEKAIYTVEDPIEYPIRGLHQIEVLNGNYGETFKAILRGDPDGVFVGEIRDGVTASFCLQGAAAGHLSMATLHVLMISGIVPRLTDPDMGLTRQALTNPHILNMLVFQALVPLVCKACGLTADAAADADPDIRELLHLLRKKFRVPTAAMRFTNQAGCEHCRRGTTGRTLVAEMWQPDHPWLKLVRANEDYEALMYYRRQSDRNFSSPDMTGKVVFEHALYKALQGQIDPRSCSEFETFERFELLDQQGTH